MGGEIFPQIWKNKPNGKAVVLKTTSNRESGVSVQVRILPPDHLVAGTIRQTDPQSCLNKRKQEG